MKTNAIIKRKIYDSTVMKKLMYLLTLFSISSYSLSNDGYTCFQNGNVQSQVAEYCINYNSLKAFTNQSGDKVLSAWVKINLRYPDNFRGSAVKQQVELDYTNCSHGTMAAAKYIKYDTQGNILYSETIPQGYWEYEPDTPGTIGYLIEQAICN